MSLRCTETGEIFEWSGGRFGPSPQTCEDMFDFDGSTWSDTKGDHEKRFTWETGFSAMHHCNGDRSKDVTLQGDEILPSGMEPELMWSIVGHTLRSRDQLTTWEIDGVPREVLVGFVASILNPRVRETMPAVDKFGGGYSDEEEGGGGGGGDADEDYPEGPSGGGGGGGVAIPMRGFTSSDPWEKAKDGTKTTFVAGCQQGHGWEVIPKTPMEKTCQCCNSKIPTGSTAYESGCIHVKTTIMCSDCGAKFKSLVKRPGAEHPVIDFSRGGAERFLMKRETECVGCKVTSPDGCYDEEAKKYYCQKCADIKKFSVAYFMRMICG